MPTNVDRQTFTALVLSQAAINFARGALPYGSANQVPDLVKEHGQVINRLNAARDGLKVLLHAAHGPYPAHFGATPEAAFPLYACALGTGLAMYYGAGNCGENAQLTFNFLVTFGYPGIRIRRVSSTVLDHAYCLIDWTGCTDPVVCDAWPTNPQACLWSHFFANRRKTPPTVDYKVRQSFNVTADTMGTDLVGEAFAVVDPTHVESLPPASRLTGYTDDVITQYIDEFLGHGVYNMVSPLANAYLPAVDYRYLNERGQTETLANVAPQGEQWTGKVERAIVEVDKRLHMLNPALRYTR